MRRSFADAVLLGDKLEYARPTAHSLSPSDMERTRNNTSLRESPGLIRLGKVDKPERAADIKIWRNVGQVANREGEDHEDWDVHSRHKEEGSASIGAMKHECSVQSACVQADRPRASLTIVGIRP